MTTPRNVMWQGTCTHLPFEQQLEATRLSGCNTLSMTPHDFRIRTEQGLSAQTMKSMAADSGVMLGHLDPVATWAPAWIPQDVPAEYLTYFGTPVAEFLSIAEELECESFSAICTFPLGLVDIDALTEAFASLCERSRGLRVDLEFIPIWGLPDLEAAWRVVKDADQPNGGILLDFWHFVRSGSPLSLLEQIPGERIHAVQVCDAFLHKRAGRTDLEDTLEDRLPAGEGQFPIDDLLNALAKKGALSVVGPEYFSSRMNGLSASGVAQVVDDTYWTRMAEFLPRSA